MGRWDSKGAAKIVILPLRGGESEKDRNRQGVGGWELHPHPLQQEAKTRLSRSINSTGSTGFRDIDVKARSNY